MEPYIQKSFVLDHFFFSANEQQFAELKSLFLLLDCADHQHVKTDGDEWEGLYLYTRGQFYLEVLQGRRPHCSGVVCQKPRNPLFFDAREIQKELPHLSWQSFDRSIEGQKWFTALSCDNYMDLSTPFNTWIMHYYQMNRKALVTYKKYEVQTIFEFNVSANPGLLEKIRGNSAWFNAVSVFEKDKITFDFQTYYSDPMRMNVELNEET